MSNFVLTPNAVVKLRRAIAPRSGNTGAAAASGRPIDPDTFPAPWTVRWSASANNKQGTWVIWLPDIAQLVMFEGVYLNIGGVTAEQALPEGWYTIDDATASSTEVYLVVTITKSDNGEIVSVDAELSTSEGQATTDETVHNILVAEMETDAETGAKRVKQYVDSAVVLGGEGGGAPVTPDDISTEFIPDPPAGTQPDGDEGKLQIKGFKAGTPADQNTLPDYLQGVANIPSGGISIVCRGVDTNGGRRLFYLPLAAIWGDGTSGGLPLPEVTYLDDVTWTSSHQLVKHWVKKNIVTGVETPIQGAPQGKVATIDTTPISSIIPQSS
jgi:hypothetical protein